MRIRRLKLSGFKSFVEPAELRSRPDRSGRAQWLRQVQPAGSDLLDDGRSSLAPRGGGMDDVIFAARRRLPETSPKCRSSSNATFRTKAERANASRAGSSGRRFGLSDRWARRSRQDGPCCSPMRQPSPLACPRQPGQDRRGNFGKPVERRQLLEEAAGISGLHARRKDAEQKLRAAEANRRGSAKFSATRSRGRSETSSARSRTLSQAHRRDPRPRGPASSHTLAGSRTSRRGRNRGGQGRGRGGRAHSRGHRRFPGSPRPSE